MTKIFIVSDNNQTDGECGYIIGLSHEYETALRLKREYIERAESEMKDHHEKFPHDKGFAPFAVRYPHNIEIIEKVVS